MESFFPVSNIDVALALTLLALLFLALWNIAIERRLYRLTMRGKAENLDEALERLLAHADSIDEFRHELETYLASVEGRLRQSIQGTSVVRFNPFRGTGSGGNQSFATAFLNEHGNGIVISTLYAHEHISIFAKPVKKFKSEFELTEEEKRAVGEAQAMLRLQ